MLRRTDWIHTNSCSLGAPPWAMRYLPEGDDDDPEAKKAAEEKAKQEAFDKERQAKEQNAANERKYQEAQARATEAEGTLATVQQQLEDNQVRLDELEQQAAEQGITGPDLKIEDYSGDDVPLVKAVLAQRKSNEAINARLDKAEKAQKERDQKAQEQEAAGQRSKVFNDILTELDEDYGAQNRNAAIKLWDAKVAAGEVPKGNPARATRIMEKCYKEAKTAADKAEKENPTVNLDSGRGGGGPGSGLRKVPLKSGSLEEVSAQLAGSSNKKSYSDYND